MAILPIHTALENPDIVGNFQRGMQFGAALREQKRKEQDLQNLRALAPQIQAGDDMALGQAAAINPEYAQSQKDVANGGIRRLRGAINFIEQAKKSGNPQAVEAAYQQVRPYLARFGQEPPATFAEAAPKFEEAKLRIAMMESEGLNPKDIPSGFQQFQMTAQAAGLQPGTPEYQQAARIALGQEGRAASGGYSFEMIKGADGRERPARRNPRDGSVEVFTGDMWVPLGGPAAMGGATSSLGNPMFTGPDGMPIAIGADVDPAVRAQIMQNPGAFNALPDQSTAQLPPVARTGAYAVGRSPEEQAALTTGAQEAAKAPYTIQEAQAKSDIEIREAARKAEQEAAIKRQEALRDAEQKRFVDANTTLGLLDEAEQLIKQSTGSRAGALRDEVAATFGVATEGAQAIAALNPVAARLTLAVPRMEGPQSDADRLLYQKAAGDFANPQVPRETRIAALQQMRRLAMKYKDVKPAAGRPPRAVNPTTGEVLVLRNGQWVPE